MKPDTVARLTKIAKGALLQSDRVPRVTGVTDPPSPAPQEDLLASSGEAQARVTPVTPVTRIYAITGNDVSNATGCTERMTDPAEPRRLDIAGGVEERAAMAQHGAGFPAEFALAFAHLQVNTPADVDEEVWHRAVDAAFSTSAASAPRCNSKRDTDTILVPLRRAAGRPKAPAALSSGHGGGLRNSLREWRVPEIKYSHQACTLTSESQHWVTQKIPLR